MAAALRGAGGGGPSRHVPAGGGVGPVGGAAVQGAPGVVRLGGQTAFELSKQVAHDDGRAIAANQIATRLGELRDLGLVVRSRQFPDGPVLERATTPGNRGIVHEITLGGINAFLAVRYRNDTK